MSTAQYKITDENGNMVQLFEMDDKVEIRHHLDDTEGEVQGHFFKYSRSGNSLVYDYTTVEKFLSEPGDYNDTYKFETQQSLFRPAVLQLLGLAGYALVQTEPDEVPNR